MIRPRWQLVIAPALIAGTAVALAQPVAASQDIFRLSIDKKVVVEATTDPNYSQVGVSVDIRCDAALPDTGFYVFVSQPQAPSSFGYVTAQCTGKNEHLVAHVQSNYGTTYVAGDATATLTNFQVGVSRVVQVPAG